MEVTITEEGTGRIWSHESTTEDPAEALSELVTLHFGEEAYCQIDGLLMGRVIKHPMYGKGTFTERVVISFEEWPMA